MDVLDEYAGRAYADFYPYELDRHGRTTEGRLNEPHGVGFPLLIAPAYAIGGAKGVELFLAAIAALAVALAYRLALRVAPDPWALGAALAVGLSPPFLAYGTAVYPELAAGAALAGRRPARAAAATSGSRGRTRSPASRCSARCRGSARSSCRPGVVIGAVRGAGALARAAADARDRRGRALAVLAWPSTWRSTRRSTAAPRPTRPRFRARRATDAGFPGRLPRARLPAGGALHRPRVRAAALGARVRARLRRACGGCGTRAASGWRRRVPGRARHRAGGRALRGGARGPARWWPPSWRPRCSASGSRRATCWPALPLAVPLVAMGLRHLPRIGSALAALTVAGVGVALRGRALGRRLARDRPAGRAVRPAHRRCSRCSTPGGGWPFWLAGAVGVAVLLVVLREARAARHSRQTAGATRAKYSG